MITWNGITSDSLGIFVESAPEYVKPRRKVDVYSVPGRSGDIIRPQNAWENVSQVYEIFAGDGTQHAVPGAFSAVAAWLYGPSGYQRLEDDFDPTHFRLAHFAGPFDIENLMTRVGRASITFDCKPQRFLKSGETPVTMIVPGTITNPTAFAARPLLLVTGGGVEGTVTVNGTVFAISDTTVPIYIDCESMNCYDGSGNNKNSIVTSSTSEFATLATGANQIGFSGAVSTVQITPRWWEL